MATAKPMKMTPAGLKKLEEELNYLKTTKRTEIADKIKVALSFGDLSENSEYDEAKNEQGIIEGRIAELEKTLANVVIVDESELSTDTVNIGNTVKIQNKKTRKNLTVTLVSGNEVNVKEMKISDESPVGAAIIGHTVGETVEAETPAGLVKYKIVEINK